MSTGLGREDIRFQSVADNRNLKLFSQLNELYGSASTVLSASDNHTG